MIYTDYNCSYSYICYLCHINFGLFCKNCRIRTGRIAISFAVFNVFALLSRTANTIQAPLLAKTIENSINLGNSEGLLYVLGGYFCQQPWQQ